jgi:hypothetical protein
VTNKLITALLETPGLRALWDVDDRGMPVLVHSLDVALLALDKAGRLDRLVVAVGALVHDASKAPLALPDTLSHSFVMRTQPELAAEPSMALVAEAERSSGVVLEAGRRDHIRHVVLSHHGNHGKVHPGTPEARLVAAADQFSGTQHRIAPVDANDILPLLAEGYKWGAAAALLGVGRELIKARLRDACNVAGVQEWVDLMPIWRRDGRVVPGDARLERRITRSRELHRLVRQLPDCLLDAVGGGPVSGADCHPVFIEGSRHLDQARSFAPLRMT